MFGRYRNITALAQRGHDRRFGILLIACLQAAMPQVTEGAEIMPGYDLVSLGRLTVGGIQFAGIDYGSFDFGGAVGEAYIGSTHLIFGRGSSASVVIDPPPGPVTAPSVTMSLVGYQAVTTNMINPKNRGLDYYYVTMNPVNTQYGTYEIRFDSASNGVFTTGTALRADLVLRKGSVTGEVVSWASNYLFKPLGNDANPPPSGWDRGSTNWVVMGTNGVVSPDSTNWLLASGSTDLVLANGGSNGQLGVVGVNAFLNGVDTSSDFWYPPIGGGGGGGGGFGSDEGWGMEGTFWWPDGDEWDSNGEGGATLAPDPPHMAPEPATWSLLAGGAALAVMLRRRTRRRAETSSRGFARGSPD